MRGSVRGASGDRRSYRVYQQEIMVTKKAVTEEQKVPILLSEEQIALIREHTFAEKALLKCLSLSEVSGKKRKVQFTLHDLEDFEGHVAAIANHCDDRKLQSKLDKICEEIQKVQNKYDLVY